MRPLKGSGLPASTLRFESKMIDSYMDPLGPSRYYLCTLTLRFFASWLREK